MTLLREIGRLREQREAERGGISLRLPAQEVVLDGHGADLRFDAPLPVEGWNAQISLLTGIVAADLMVKGGVGLLRTLPSPAPSTLDELRRSAQAIGVVWPAGTSYPDFVRSLDPADARDAVLLNRAARTVRGAGYTNFDGVRPEHPEHAAVASTYAHVTAPLRRVADRFANEVVLALVQERRPPSWVTKALGDLPEVMSEAAHRERALERAVVDVVEALVLAPHVGETFAATVVSADKDRAMVQLADPAVVGSIDGHDLVPGAVLQVRLVEADVNRRTVRFAPAV
jgi:exoribonuclease R